MDTTEEEIPACLMAFSISRCSSVSHSFLPLMLSDIVLQIGHDKPSWYVVG